MDSALMNVMLNGIEAMRGTGGDSKRTEHGRLPIPLSDTGVGVPVMSSASSRRSSLSNCKAPAWDCRSAAGRSRRMGIICGRAPTQGGGDLSVQLASESQVHDFVYRRNIANRVRQCASPRQLIERPTLDRGVRT
jgi:hypothetical protein